MLSKLFYALSVSFFLVSCATQGTDFFIRNHKSENILITYEYVHNAAADFDYAPALQVLNHNGIIKNRKLQAVMKKMDTNMVFAERIDLFRYTLTLPAQSTVYIKPVYQYGSSIKQLVIHSKDSVLFKEEYPGIVNQDYIENGAYKHKYRLIGKSYEVFDIKKE
ncbi:MAG TPA: hypothetical protein ENK75_05515 [Saprospiraceae bacterium]|nr:hypothetical protein [Saprospiraceae bacterium]